MTAILDYGVGNLFSLKSSFEFIGEKVIVTNDPEEIRAADRLILPGVGAFRDAADKLFKSGIADIIKEEVAKGKPLLGICLGMQLLFDKSYEYGEYKGLGLIKGNINPIEPLVTEDYKIPHIGWNRLRIVGEKNELFKYINDGDHVYFVHSYFADDCKDAVIADTEYGAVLTAAVAKDNVYGCQFHPEKSSDTGLNILRAFVELGGK